MEKVRFKSGGKALVGDLYLLKRDAIRFVRHRACFGIDQDAD